MFSMINRGRMPQAIQEEFEHLFSRLRGFLSQAFDEDGELIVADPNLAVTPVGGLMQFAGSVAPAGYLICDGSQVSRVTYKSLFDVVGVTYGAGDGSTTFNIPDLRQRFPLGKAAAGTGAALGSTGGAIDHTHNIGAHSHNVTGSTSSDGSHNHTVNAHSHSVSDHQHSYSGTTDATSGNSTAPDTGGSLTVSNYTHTHGYSGTTGLGGPGATGNASPGTDSQGAHSHTLTGTTDTAAAVASTTNNPPFLSLNYIIFAGI